MMFFKCFKEKIVTSLEYDSEDFEEGTTLSVHKSLTDLQSLLMLPGPKLHLASLQISAIQNSIR